MQAICLTCGRFGEIEAHHVAGQHNHRTLTVSVCVDCHRILTSWQLAAGIELHQDAPRTSADASRALIVGVVHLIQLCAQRHPARIWISQQLAIHTGRAGSRLLDALQPADRLGRWLPDPGVPPVEGEPVTWPEDHQAAWFREFALFVLQLADILGEPDQTVIDAVTRIAADPLWWDNALEQSVDDPAVEQRINGRLDDYTAAWQNFTRRMLDNDALAHLDEQLLAEIRQCVELSRVLLIELCDVPGEPGGTR